MSACASTTLKITFFPQAPSEFTGALLENLQELNCSNWNYLWIYPTHAVTSTIGIVLAPIVALVNLICAPLFSLISCCQCNPEEKAKLKHLALDHLIFGFINLIELPIRLFLKIFYPPLPSLAPIFCGSCINQSIERSHKIPRSPSRHILSPAPSPTRPLPPPLLT